MKNLVIVESPAKARTIKNFLGKDYEIIASKGHIRDLPKKKLGFEIQNQTFIPEYTISSDHKEVVSRIREFAKQAQKIYIATDEDREGEAIGYHITQAIGKESSSFPRIVFHEITKSAIIQALKTPREIDMDKVNAQQARRLLDRIVGYKLSGLISSKIQRGLSGGRVQSSTLKLIVDREKEIRAFEPVRYFSIQGDFKPELNTELIAYQNRKLEKLALQDPQEVQNILEVLRSETFCVKEISKKRKKSPTPPPFMTSTLQQSASTFLNFPPAKTMRTAQKLYEGVKTHEGTMGAITYMRTDSLNIAKEAQEQAKKILLRDYGESFVPKKPKIYTSRSKNAQEAHEAIRPTNLDFTPQIAQEFLTPDELKLYMLIYQRFLASQSVEAEFESQSIYIASESGVFKASGSKLIFDGFHKITGSTDKDKLLPDLKEGEILQVEKIVEKEHFTEPPPRFSEASLIKTMESLGIGRPSTYAPTISLLSNRDYIKIEKKQIAALESAFKVIEMLTEHFYEIVDSHFTAKLEEELDEIAERKQDWQKVLWEFYEPFIQKISEGKTKIASQKLHIPTGEKCPKCQSDLLIRNGRYGEFIACSGYPQCKYTKPTEESENKALGECEKCGLPMVKKRGRNGEFIACSGYPQCKYTKSLNPLTSVNLEVKCPECGGEITQRRSRLGVFFGCGNYPQCKFISKFEPIDEKCPECGYMVAKRIYRGKESLQCIKCKHIASQQ